jgi:hypothetical protein
VDVGWFGGFFDADGSISIDSGRKTSYFLLTCSVTQVDPSPLVLFQSRFGGKINGPRSRGGNARPVYQWTVSASKAEALLRETVDYLVVKRERATLALEFRDLFKGQMILPRGKAQNDEKRQSVLLLRADAHERMRVLNKRGAA